MEGQPASSLLEEEESVEGARSEYRSEAAAPTASAASLRPSELKKYGDTASNEPTIRRKALGGFYDRYGKRAFDLVFASAFLLLVAAWLFPLIGLAIRVNSKGPIFFRQRRVGLNGKPFFCLKFRTMRHDPDGRFAQAQKNDPRITRVGAFLRRTNLDEVPQFINVLLGEMSVVGPRPHVAELDQVFASVVPGYTARNLVRPGVTGLAQVSGCRGETRSIRDMTHRVRFDSFYCRSLSFALDLKIIVLTVLRVLQGDEKAY